MDGSRSSETVGAAEAGQWVCHNCGAFNADGTTHCRECGFAYGYDPETTTAVAPVGLPPQLVAADSGTPRLLLYLTTAQLVATLVLLGLLLPVFLRLSQNWPFQSPYERDALDIASKLMTVQARLEIGLTKAQYDELVAPLLGDNARFKGMYGRRPERQRDSYQKLVQAAEYLGFAEKSWDAQLTDAQVPLSVAANARSGDADKSVQQYWQRSNTNATDALRDL